MKISKAAIQDFRIGLVEFVGSSTHSLPLNIAFQDHIEFYSIIFYLQKRPSRYKNFDSEENQEYLQVSFSSQVEWPLFAMTSITMSAQSHFPERLRNVTA